MNNGTSMTALISAFSRAYHTENNRVKIFGDSIAKKLLTDDEYTRISSDMAKGINFFNPEFQGNEEEALRWIVDNQLSPSPLSRSLFAENALEIATLMGASQYIVTASGYDTFAYRQPEWANGLHIFELDTESMIKDKKRRLKESHIAVPKNVSFIHTDIGDEKWYDNLIKNKAFSSSEISVYSLLGIVYYLSEEEFRNLLKGISLISCEQSSIVFDYPDEKYFTEQCGARVKKQRVLAEGANECMKTGYSCEYMESILKEYGFSAYEHLKPERITELLFNKYNNSEKSHKMSAFDNVNYCLAVKS